MKLSLPPHFATQSFVSALYAVRIKYSFFVKKNNMVIRDCEGNNQKAELEAEQRK